MAKKRSLPELIADNAIESAQSNNDAEEYCNCSSAETTDIRKNKDNQYIHILCNKRIT